MRILHVHNIRWWNATSNYAYNLMRAIDSLGHEQFFITGKNNPINKRLKENNWDFIPILPDKDFEYIPLYFKNFNIEKYDIIFTYWGRDQELISKKINKNQKLIRVWVDARDVKKNIFIKHLLKKTDLIIVPSKKEQEKFLLKYPFYKKFFILKGTFEKRVTCRFYNGEKIRLLNIARSDPVKGHTYFLQALKILSEKSISFKAYLMGNEANISWEQLKKEARDLGILDYCEFLGYQPDIYTYLQKANIGIISSIGSEAYSRALFEYFSAYMPVVATNVGIIPEIYEKVKFGEMVQLKSKEALANGIEQVVKNWNIYHENVKKYYENNINFNVFKKNVRIILNGV